jgi:hypothetical protein
MRKKRIILFLFLVSISLLALIGVYSLLLPKEENNNEFIEPQPPIIKFSFIYENVTEEEERTKAINIAVDDPEVKEWLGKGYEISYVALRPYLRTVGEYSVGILTQEQRLPWVIGVSLRVNVNITIEEVKSFSYELAFTSLSEEQKEEVMNIATAYVEENYGTDYITTSDVDVKSYEESIEGKTTFRAYPQEEFRIPSNMSQEGIVARVFVDLENGETVKVSKSSSGVSMEERGPPLIPFSPPDFSTQNVKVSQGGSASTNLTFSSILYEEDLTVSFSLEFGAYQNMPVASDDLSPFVVAFDPDPLVLKYLEPKTVTITITADDDTPLGLYTMTINWIDENRGVGLGVTLWITVVQ